MAGFWKTVGRSLRLRCPVCGESKLFQGLFKMNETCPSCHARYEREAGFFLGSIYFNYGLTALVVAIGYPVLLFTEAVPEKILLPVAAAFAILFPVWFFRYARSLWIGFDQIWDPRKE